MKSIGHGSCRGMESSSPPAPSRTFPHPLEIPAHAHAARDSHSSHSRDGESGQSERSLPLMPASVLDHPPLRAIARFLEMPPAPLPPTYLQPSERATLTIATDLEALLTRAQEDFKALPLLTPTAIKMAAVAIALAAHRLLPFPAHDDALQQLVGLMQHRVIANTHRDGTFHQRSPLLHFHRAFEHFRHVRRWITSPAKFPTELLHIRQELADFSVYLVFATYSAPRIV